MAAKTLPQPFQRLLLCNPIASDVPRLSGRSKISWRTSFGASSPSSAALASTTAICWLSAAEMPLALRVGEHEPASDSTAHCCISCVGKFEQVARHCDQERTEMGHPSFLLRLPSHRLHAHSVSQAAACAASAGGLYCMLSDDFSKMSTCSGARLRRGGGGGSAAVSASAADWRGVGGAGLGDEFCEPLLKREVRRGAVVGVPKPCGCCQPTHCRPAQWVECGIM